MAVRNRARSEDEIIYLINRALDEIGNLHAMLFPASVKTDTEYTCSSLPGAVT